MMNMDKILNGLVAQLLTSGNAEFSEGGLKIKTSYDNGCLKLSASFEAPEDHSKEIKELTSNFKNYIQSLTDDFFVETAESFEEGELKEIQEMLDSENLDTVKSGIEEFMHRLRVIANSKINSLNSDIEAAEKELEELIEIRDSYIHVMNKKF